MWAIKSNTDCLSVLKNAKLFHISFTDLSMKNHLNHVSFLMLIMQRIKISQNSVWLLISIWNNTSKSNNSNIVFSWVVPTYDIWRKYFFLKNYEHEQAFNDVQKCLKYNILARGVWCVVLDLQYQKQTHETHFITSWKYSFSLTYHIIWFFLIRNWSGWVFADEFQ